MAKHRWADLDVINRISTASDYPRECVVILHSDHRFAQTAAVLVFCELGLNLKTPWRFLKATEGQEPKSRGGPCEEPPSKVENFLMDVFEVSGCAGSEALDVG